MKVSILIKELSKLDKNSIIEFYEKDTKADFFSLAIKHQTLIRDTGYSKIPQTVKLTIISK